MSVGASVGGYVYVFEVYDLPAVLPHPMRILLRGCGDGLCVSLEVLRGPKYPTLHADSVGCHDILCRGFHDVSYR